MKTWNRERKRTRDRLLDYEFTIVPPHPHSGGIPFIFPIETDSSIPILDAASTVLPIIYPWENVQLDFLEDEIFAIARRNGFEGTKSQLWDVFSRDGYVVQATLDTFPWPGNPKNLYLDSETGIVYYFKTSSTINYENAENAGAIIRQLDTNIYYLYIPVRALLIENTILDSGDALEYIG